jgi:hypothetical protein
LLLLRLLRWLLLLLLLQLLRWLLLMMLLLQLLRWLLLLLLLLLLPLLLWDIATIKCAAMHKVKVPHNDKAPAWSTGFPLLQGALDDLYIFVIGISMEVNAHKVQVLPSPTQGHS